MSLPTSSDAPALLTRREQMLQGARAQLPTLAGVIPFGLAAGAFTATALSSPGAGIALHAAMFAGRGQMVAMQMYRDGAPLGLMALAALIVNLRNLMYGASIARQFTHLSAAWRFCLAFFLVDNVYALSIKRLESDAVTRNANTRHFFYLGCALATFTAWVMAGVAGAFFGAWIPPSFGLDFVPNLSFIYILAMNMQRRADLAAGLIAAVVAVLGAGLPWQLGLFLGVLAGLFVGSLATPARQQEPA